MPDTYLESLNQSLLELMGADERVLVLGEDILDPYGGAFKVTRGLSSRFPGRVLATPLSEATIIGLASGLAMRGLRPIAEIMFGDFLWLGGDQLVNHAAKFRWMYNDQVRVPLVVRTPMGGRRGYGPTHSQSAEKHFMGVPGLWIVAPHVLAAPGDLLKQATLACPDPVVFIESKTCYSRPLVRHVPSMTSDVLADEQTAPFPSVHLRHGRAGVPDGLLWCYGAMVPHALEAVQHLRDGEGLYFDLVAVSQLSPVPADQVRQVLAAVRPAVSVYVEEGSAMFGWSAELAAVVQEEAARLDHAMTHVRIGSVHTPIPSSRELERQTLPQVQDIVARVLECF